MQSAAKESSEVTILLLDEVDPDVSADACHDSSRGTRQNPAYHVECRGSSISASHRSLLVAKLGGGASDDHAAERPDGGGKARSGGLNSPANDLAERPRRPRQA